MFGRAGPIAARIWHTAIRARHLRPHVQRFMKRTTMGAKLLPASLAAAALCLSGTSVVRAATFSSAYYDPQTNEVVVTLVYGGTNPDHQFSVQWGECHPLGNAGNGHQLVGEVLDSQWNDVAKQTYTKTVRFSLGSMTCRPATLTLRTAPRYETTLQIP
jgi:hypothetical protein